jgi:hypothetical protein
MDELEDLIKLLGSKRTDGYGPRRIPHRLDQDVHKLLGVLSRATDDDRAAALSRMVERHGSVMVAFAERMASHAVRTGQSRYLDYGMTALAVASYLIYIKEVIPILSLLYRSTQKLGLEARGVFNTAIPVPAAAGLQQIVDEFLNRSERDRSIEVMYYVEGQDQDGFRYTRTSPLPAPSRAAPRRPGRPRPHPAPVRPAHLPRCPRHTGSPHRPAAGRPPWSSRWRPTRSASISPPP